MHFQTKFTITLFTIVSTMLITSSAVLDVAATMAMQPQIACGSIDRITFHSIFDSQEDKTLVNTNFDALAASCNLIGISNMDSNQLSFFLGSLSRNTNGLGSHDTFLVQSAQGESLYFDQYYPRGSLMMYGKENYEIVQNYSVLLGSPYDLVAQPELVASNLVMSYVSGLTMMITEMDTSTDSCMTWTSQGNFGKCVAFLNPFECANQNEQLARLTEVQRVSNVLGTSPITNDKLAQSMCTFERLNSTAVNVTATIPVNYTAMVSNWTTTNGANASTTAAAGQITDTTGGSNQTSSTAAPVELNVRDVILGSLAQGAQMIGMSGFPATTAVPSNTTTVTPTTTSTAAPATTTAVPTTSATQDLALNLNSFAKALNLTAGQSNITNVADLLQSSSNAIKPASLVVIASIVFLLA